MTPFPAGLPARYSHPQPQERPPKSLVACASPGQRPSEILCRRRVGTCIVDVLDMLLHRRHAHRPNDSSQRRCDYPYLPRRPRQSYFSPGRSSPRQLKRKKPNRRALCGLTIAPKPGLCLAHFGERPKPTFSPVEQLFPGAFLGSGPLVRFNFFRHPSKHIQHSTESSQ